MTSGQVHYRKWEQGDVVSEDKVKELGLIEGVDYKKGGMNWRGEKLNLLEAPGVARANSFEIAKSRKGLQNAVDALDKGIQARVSGLLNEVQKHQDNAKALYPKLPSNNNTTTGGGTYRTHSGKSTGGGDKADTRTEYQKRIDTLEQQTVKAKTDLENAIYENVDKEIISELWKNVEELKRAKEDLEGAVELGVPIDQYRITKVRMAADEVEDVELEPLQVKVETDLDAFKKGAEDLGKQFASYIPTDQLYKFTEEYQSAVEQLKGTEWGESLFNMLEGDTTADKVSGIGQSFQALGNVLANFDGAAAKAGAVLAAVGQIVLGFAQASVMASKLGPIGWIAWLGAGLAAVATTIATIKGFADGGIIEGSSYHGDRIVARLNAGEMVLNRKQQANLFRALDNGIASNAGGKVEFEIKGSTLKGVLKNYDNKMNKVR